MKDVTHITSLKVKRSAPIVEAQLELRQPSERIRGGGGSALPPPAPPPSPPPTPTGEPMPYDPTTILEFMSLYSANQFKSPKSSSGVTWSLLLDKNEDGEPDKMGYPDYLFEDDKGMYDKGKQANISLLQEMSGWLEKGIKARVEHKFPKDLEAKRRRKGSFNNNVFAKWELLMDCCNSMQTFLEHDQKWADYIEYVNENCDPMQDPTTLACMNEELPL